MGASDLNHADSVDAEKQSSGAYRYYVLLALTFAYVLSIIDRGIISVVLTDIKQEFEFTDFQLGLLGGLAFALFYSILGLPIARLADRHNRKNIVSAAISIWSAFTALCGMAVGFWTLFLARVGVGVGEAGGTPPSHSIISDYFKKSELGRALGIYSIGSVVGVMAGHVLGSLLVQNFGWRYAFILLGVPGVFLGALIFFTVREPKRLIKPSKEVANQSFGASLKSLLENRSYLGAALGHALALVPTYALFIFIFPLVERRFEMDKVEIAGYTSTALLFGAAGMFLGGTITDFMIRRSAKWMAWSPAIWIIVAMPAYIGLMFANTIVTMMLCYGLFIFLVNLHHAPTFQIIQTYVNPNQKALGVAVALFMSNIVGNAIMPSLTGYLSDTVFSGYGDASLSYAMAVLGLTAIPASWFFYNAGRQMVDDNKT